MPAARSSSDGPEGRFSFFHPKVKVKKTISLTSFVFWGLVGLKSLLVGGGGVVVCLIIVSTPGPDFAKVKARFGQVGDHVGLG